MNRYSKAGMLLGLAVMIFAILALNTALRPGDSGKGTILAACIWAYLLFVWRPWRKSGSRHHSSGSTVSK